MAATTLLPGYAVLLEILLEPEYSAEETTVFTWEPSLRMMIVCNLLLNCFSQEVNRLFILCTRQEIPVIYKATNLALLRTYPYLCIKI